MKNIFQINMMLILAAGFFWAGALRANVGGRPPHRDGAGRPARPDIGGRRRNADDGRRPGHRQRDFLGYRHAPARAAPGAERTGK